MAVKSIKNVGRSGDYQSPVAVIINRHNSKFKIKLGVHSVAINSQFSILNSKLI
jgi:hypothetical protein